MIELVWSIDCGIGGILKTWLRSAVPLGSDYLEASCVIGQTVRGALEVPWHRVSALRLEGMVESRVRVVGDSLEGALCGVFIMWWSRVGPECGDLKRDRAMVIVKTSVSFTPCPSSQKLPTKTGR